MAKFVFFCKLMSTVLLFYSAVVHANEFKKIGKLAKHSGSITDIVIDRDGESIQIFSADASGQIQVSQSKGNAEVIVQFDARINKISASTNGKYILVAGNRGLLSLIEKKTKTIFKNFSVPEGVEYTALSSVTQEGWFVAGTQRGAVELWNVDSTKAEKSWTASSWPVRSVAFSPDLKNVIAAYGSKIIMWNTADDSIQLNLMHPDTPNPNIQWIDHSVITESGLIFIASNNKIRGFDFLGNDLFSIQAHAKEISSLAVSNENCCLVTVGRDSYLKLWDVSRNIEIKGQLTFLTFYLKAAYSEGFLVTANWLNTLELWKLSTP